MVICANEGYLPDMTNFSCRVIGRRRLDTNRSDPDQTGSEEKEVDIISMLKGYASRLPGLKERMGENFARGHKEASGGIVRTEDFEELWKVMCESRGQENASDGSKLRNQLLELEIV